MDNVSRLLDAATWINEKLPQQDEIISGGLLPQNSIAVVGGVSKQGKSVFVLNMAVKMATGKPFLGFDIPRRKKVFYLQAEISAVSMQNRLRKMLLASNYELMPESLYLMNDKGLKLDRQRDLDHISKLVEKYQVHVMIIDPLYKYHSGDENKVADMTRIFDRVDSLISRHNISVVIVHHFGKPSEFRAGTSSFRGSSTITDYADSYMMLRRKSGDESRNFLKLDFELRNAEEPGTMILFRDPETLWYSVEGVESDRKATIHDCISILEEAGGSLNNRDLFIDLIRTKTGASKRTIGKVLIEAEKLKRILSKPGAGKGSPKVFYLPGKVDLFSATRI